MMMKYRSMSKYHRVVLVGLLLFGLVFIFRFQVAKLTSPISESVAALIDRFSTTKTTLVSENQDLKKKLANVIADNQRLRLELQSLNSDFDIANDQIVGTAKIISLPLAYPISKNGSYGLSQIELAVDTNNVFVGSENFIYGLLNSKKTFRPFENTDQLTAILSDGEVVEVSIERSFIYQIELPKAIDGPDGLIELNTGKVLGFKVDQTTLNPTTNVFTYRLPVMPTLYQSVILLK